jgi:protein-disulfide isomerase
LSRPALRTTLLALGAVLALSGCQKEDDAAFGKRVRAYLLAHPEVLNETISALQRKQQLELTKSSAEKLGRFRAQLERDPRDAVINPGGSITVVEFFDYRCGYCKVIAPHVVELIEQNPDVRFVIKQFPIFGEVSDEAAKMALTPEGKSKALVLYKSLMAEKALDQDILDRRYREAGLDPAAVRKAAASPDIERHLLDVRTLAQGLGLEGTPAFVVGDTLIPGADLDALKAAIVTAKGKRKSPQAT